MIVTAELDTESVKMNQQDKLACQILRSKVISFKKYCPDTNADRVPTALLGH